MNSETLFQIFDENDNIPISEEVKLELNNKMNSDEFNIKMFITMINNKSNIKSLFEKKYKQNNYNYDLNSIIDKWVYTRSLKYLHNINFTSETLSREDKIGREKMKRCLQESIEYFQKLEMYENCSFLFNIKKIIE